MYGQCTYTVHVNILINIKLKLMLKQFKLKTGLW